MLNRRGSPASESSYQGSVPGSGRSEQDSFTTQSERSYHRTELEEALLRTGYFLPEYKH